MDVYILVARDHWAMKSIEGVFAAKEPAYRRKRVLLKEQESLYGGEPYVKLDLSVEVWEVIECN